MTALQDLRAMTTASYTMRAKNGTSISVTEYDAMPSDTKEQKSAKAKYQWRADPKLVKKLVAAERAWTPAEPVRAP